MRSEALGVVETRNASLARKHAKDAPELPSADHDHRKRWSGKLNTLRISKQRSGRGKGRLSHTIVPVPPKYNQIQLAADADVGTCAIPIYVFFRLFLQMIPKVVVVLVPKLLC